MFSFRRLFFSPLKILAEIANLRMGLFKKQQEANIITYKSYKQETFSANFDRNCARGGPKE